MTSLQLHRIHTEFDKVSSRMALRRPQRDSLSIIRELLLHLPQDISDLDSKTIANHAKEIDSDWVFSSGRMQLTFALATGVGKTRLMGAIIAYLWRLGLSKNFLILAPREAILRKLLSDSKERSDKYLFVDAGFVPEAEVCHRGNLMEFGSTLLLKNNPNLYILSPQIFSAGGRINELSPTTGESLFDRLRNCKDLVVLVDESHHFGNTPDTPDANNWSQVLNELDGKLEFCMTGTPDEACDIGCEYGLRECLRDGLYTKRVRLIVDQRDQTTTDVEYDRLVIRNALERLRVKEDTLRDYAEKSGRPQVRPVALLCAMDTSHAESVERLLLKEFKMKKSEVLVIHSRRKNAEDIERLVNVESPESKVRLIVQVHVLDEGWDVTNVYVIAPLRNVRSYTNGRQVMGRGLRLPYGSRVGDREVDTLDILAFGQDTIEDIYDQAKNDFGEGSVSVTTIDHTNEDGLESIFEDEEITASRQTVVATVKGSWIVQRPVLDFIPPELNLQLGTGIDLRANSTQTAIDLEHLEMESIDRAGGLTVDQFIDYVADELVRRNPALSILVHGGDLYSLVSATLNSLDVVREGRVSIDPEALTYPIHEALASANAHLCPSYLKTELPDLSKPLQNSILSLPQGITNPIDGPSVQWNPARHKRVPISGWARSTHSLVSFDTKPEYELAVKLDRMEGVKAWFRNDPKQFRIQTTVRAQTSPDFIVWTTTGNQAALLIVEVKGEHFWDPGRSEAWRESRDLSKWAMQANEKLGRKAFSIVYLMSKKVTEIHTLEQMVNMNAAEHPTEG